MKRYEDIDWKNVRWEEWKRRRIRFEDEMDRIEIGWPATSVFTARPRDCLFPASCFVDLFIRIGFREGERGGWEMIPAGD